MVVVRVAMVMAAELVVAVVVVAVHIGTVLQ